MVKKEDNQLKEYNYAIIVIGGAVFAFILILLLGALPLWNDMKKNNTELTNKKAELSALETKLVNLKNLSTKEADLKTQNAKLLAALPQDNDISRLFVQFESIALQSGLSVARVSGDNVIAPAGNQPNTVTKTIVPITYQISATAQNYSSLRNALKNFEKALRLISISDLKISGTQSKLEANFTVTTYMRGANE